MGEQEVGRALMEAGRLLVVSHAIPDGDCIGSTVALTLALQAAGKEVQAANSDPVPKTYHFLPGVDLVRRPADLTGRPDVVVLVDCTDPERVGEELLPRVQAAGHILSIDHHVSNNGFGHCRLVDHQAASTGELIYRLLRHLDWPISPSVATNLYTAVVTDSGSFQYENTSADTLRLAAELLERGADLDSIRENLWENTPLLSVLLLKEVLPGLTLTAGGRIAWLKVPRALFVKLGAQPEHTEGLINYPRSIEGVEVALLFRELEGGQIKIGLRSKKMVDVNRLAACFGGGGHRRAAGCVIDGPMEQAVERLVAAAEEALQA